MKKKKSKWMKLRHRIVRAIGIHIVAPYTRWKYGVAADRFKEQGNRPYLILMNHQTPFDQFFIAMSFKGPVYYLATEDIFSIGFVSSLIRYLVAPIPIKKTTTDLNAIKICFQVAKEGGTIAIAPEGNRTYSGKTEYIGSGIASLAKKLKLPIALYRIEGGYGVCPRWSDEVRKGTMHSYVSRVIEPEEYKSMTNEELFAEIEQGLYVNEGNADGIFESEHRAEYLERAVYVCPDCGLSTFESHGNEVQCFKCHKKIEYGKDKTLNGVGFDFPFKFMTEWYDYQSDFINSLDVTALTEEPLYTDTAKMSEVIVYKRKNLLRENARLDLYGDRVVVDAGSENEMILAFSDVTSMAVLGRNKLNIYHNGTIYQIKGGKRFNALKYVQLYFRFRNITKGDSDGKFLGL